jgi:hypothetical protein
VVINSILVQGEEEKKKERKEERPGLREGMERKGAGWGAGKEREEERKGGTRKERQLEQRRSKEMNEYKGNNSE